MAQPQVVFVLPLLCVGMLLVLAVVVVGAIVAGLRRGSGGVGRARGPGELSGMTDALMQTPPMAGPPHGISPAEQAMAAGIAADALAHGQVLEHAGGHIHGHEQGHATPPAVHDAGIGMPPMHHGHHGHEVSPPVHHDPGPTTMPSDFSGHHHG
ncbi:MAG: hypothetical protein ACTHN5_19515 [Phycisphaerae bacterium]